MPFQSDAPEGTHSDGSYERKSRRRAWRTKCKKSHGTLIDWCTQREWPVNCITVISAWWRSNRPFQRLSGRLSGRLNYYITRLRQEVCELEVRWVEDKMWQRKPPPSRRGPRDPRWSLETRWWQDAVEKANTQRSGPLCLRLSSSGERERHNADGHKSGSQYIAVLFGLQLSFTCKPYNKERGIFFKEVFPRLYYRVVMILSAWICIWVYNNCICIYVCIYNYMSM